MSENFVWTSFIEHKSNLSHDDFECFRLLGENEEAKFHYQRIKPLWGNITIFINKLYMLSTTPSSLYSVHIEAFETTEKNQIKSMDE